jgi:aspartyl-tRNA(Asn)/glutamyl-tRNA(Gln) amidotransferase subunit C
MSLTLQDVQRIAELARLEFQPQQAQATLAQLNHIFAMVEQMKTVDTEGVQPLNHPIAAFLPELSLRLRNDEATEVDRREDYQRPAPAVQDGLYLVPKVIE